jgi:hypothetical protein
LKACSFFGIYIFKPGLTATWKKIDVWVNLLFLRSVIFYRDIFEIASASPGVSSYVAPLAAWATILESCGIYTNCIADNPAGKGGDIF